MPLRLVPILVIVLFAALFAIGALDGETDEGSENGFNFGNAIHGVDGVLDEALTEGSFDWLHDSVSGMGSGIKDSVDVATNR